MANAYGPDPEPGDDGDPVPPTDGPDPAATAVPGRTRRRRVAAAAGVAAVVGVGALLATAYHGTGTGTVTTGAAAGAGTAHPGGATGGPAGGTARDRAAPGGGTAGPPRPGVRPDHRDAGPSTGTAVIGGTEVTVTTSGSLTADRHTLRVVSARTDLTGTRELAWAADAGHLVGDARCTQNVRLTPTAPARVRPTLLLCWRTSAERSAYTVAVDLDHRPSERDSVASLDQAWARLG